MNAIAVDSYGNSYITGSTTLSDFPTKSNSTVAFVRKFNSNGSAVIYSTYLGGTGGDLGYGLALDAIGNSYVTGVTSSRDFPVTWGSAYQTSLGPGASGNAFIAKLSADGQTLLYSSYLGGEGLDFGAGIVVDTNQNVYVAGGTSSYSFPTTLNALQSRLMSSSGNAFVARFDLTKLGTDSLVYSSYLGGTSSRSIPDQAEAVAVGANQNVYLTGVASSADFPITHETAYQSEVHPISSAFLTQIDTTRDGAAGLVYSTFLGGSHGGSGAYANGIAVDSCGKVCLAGGTSSLDFPTTTGVPNSQIGKAFVAKFDTTQSKTSSLMYSTLIGGSNGEFSRTLLVDSDGNTYVSGWTNSSDFPVTDGAIQRTLGASGGNIFVAVLSPDASTILYGTYLGGIGSRNEMPGGLAFDSDQNIYIAGRTSSADFQITPGSFQASPRGIGGGFIAKLTALHKPTISSGCSLRSTHGSSGTVNDAVFGPIRRTRGIILGSAKASIPFPSSPSASDEAPDFLTSDVLTPRANTRLRSSYVVRKAFVTPPMKTPMLHTSRLTLKAQTGGTRSAAQRIKVSAVESDAAPMARPAPPSSVSIVPSLVLIFTWVLAVISLAFAAFGRICINHDLSGEVTFAVMVMAATLLNSCGFVGGSPATRSGTYSGQPTLKPSGNPIPEMFFGMHIHRLASTTPWPKLSFGSWRLWDAYVAWPYLEPQKGKWSLANLDLYVTQAEQHHVGILLPLALSPTWASARPSEPSSIGIGPGAAAEPARMEDWRGYVRTIATRYEGRVHFYEIWNEPNLKEFYSGSIPELVQIACAAYSTLKSVDPSVLVGSPPFTGTSGLSMFDQYLKAGGSKCADIVGYHLYVNPEPPEKMVPLIQQVQAIMAKNGVGNRQLWDTETGWAIENAKSVVKPAPGGGFNGTVLPLEQASAYVARTYILSWACQVLRLYWYAWDDDVMGLTEKDGKTIKAPAVAYAEVQKWLVGARMTSCELDSTQTWVCTLSREGGYTGWIVWNPTQTQKFELPRDWDAMRMRDLHGLQWDISLKSQIEIGPSPFLLESAGN